VIASSTSTFLPSALVARCQHPERVIVGHPFAPAHLLPLVEVVGSAATPAAVLDWACAFYAALGKRPLRLKKEIQSFIANRLQYAIQDEANHLIDAGVCDSADINTARAGGSIVSSISAGAAARRPRRACRPPWRKRPAAWPWTIWSAGATPISSPSAGR
jgi:hypothetical protein